MAITTVAQYLTAPKQIVRFIKTAAVTSVANLPSNMFNQPGDPGAGVYTGYGVGPYTKPEAGRTGYPKIAAFPSGMQGYITGVRFSCTVPCRLQLFDVLVATGPLTSASTYASLSDDAPTFDERVPWVGEAASYEGLQLWYECSTTGRSGTVPIIWYTDSEGAYLPSVMDSGALIGRRMLQLGLSAGSSGVWFVDGQSAGASSSGSGNALIMRPLWSGRVREAGGEYFDDYIATGMPEIFETSALYLVVTPDGTSTGTPDLQIEIANG